MSEDIFIFLRRIFCSLLYYPFEFVYIRHALIGGGGRLIPLVNMGDSPLFYLSLQYCVEVLNSIQFRASFRCCNAPVMNSRETDFPNPPLVGTITCVHLWLNSQNDTAVAK